MNILGLGRGNESGMSWGNNYAKIAVLFTVPRLDLCSVGVSILYNDCLNS
jgi:hypothetical protein